jgi:hypothetical protein
MSKKKNYFIEKIRDDFQIIYDDDGKGEIADIIGINDSDTIIDIHLFHLKYAKNGIVSNEYRLKFGLNDWQFPTGSEFIPSPLGASNQIVSNMKLVSPIKFGPTAFWTGSSGINVRIDDHNQSVYKNYSEFSGKQSNTQGLIGWWEMAITDSPTGIGAENNPSKKLIISGDNPTSLNTSVTASVLLTEVINTQKQNIELPFGGFPGTEKYG